MRNWMIAAALLAPAATAMAEPSAELVMSLKAAVVKVHVADQNNNHGIGTGVVVSQDHVATNCHVIANARGVNIRKFGENFAPVAIKADWRHDLCLLKFKGLDIKPVELGESGHLNYEQSIFSIGFPQNTPKPQVSHGKIKALYPLDDSRVIRASASFRMGASGSPLLDEDGRLIGISTFKSPGRNSYYYSLPVEWVKKLLTAAESASMQQAALPFWDAPEEQQPYFMRVVLPYMGGRWDDLSLVAQHWGIAEPDNPEAWYYRAYAEERLGNSALATTYYQKVLTLHPQHAGALFELGVLASRQGDQVEYERISMLLSQLDLDIAQELSEAVAKPQP